MAEDRTATASLAVAAAVVTRPKSDPNRFDCTLSDQGQTLAAVLRSRLPGHSWNAVRRLCTTGKVSVQGAVIVDPAHRVDLPSTISIQMTAPRPREIVPGFRVVFDDAHLVVIEKPAGISSVPFERKETGTALDLVRDHWRSLKLATTTAPLHTVHRLDKETSGLLCFAKSKAAERGLHQIFQRHLSTRSYLALAHGKVQPGRIESRLVPDRGDHLRGSTRNPNLGQLAVTNVEVIEQLGTAATLCRIRLETGRTHQIRIHLSESSHPIVGDDVYNRDALRRGATLIASSRMMLHAETLGFTHPVTKAALDFHSPAPDEFADFVDHVRRRQSTS